MYNHLQISGVRTIILFSWSRFQILKSISFIYMQYKTILFIFSLNVRSAYHLRRNNISIDEYIELAQYVHSVPAFYMKRNKISIDEYVKIHLFQKKVNDYHVEVNSKMGCNI